MSFLSKYYSMAEAQLSLRVNKNKEKQQENIDKAEKTVPEIKNLRKQLTTGGAKLSTVLLNSKDPKKAVRDISVEIMEIKHKIKKLLVENGFDENFLDPIYSCEKCKDTGIFEEKRCSCFMNDVQRFQCDELNKTSGMNLCSFETFDITLYPDKSSNGNSDTVRKIMEKIYSYCVNYVRDFHLPNKGILMQGATGLGKTHLSLAIGNEVIKKGYSVIYGSAPNLFGKAEKEHFDKEEESDISQILHDCDLLILDDLGAEFDSKFNQAFLYNLINTRMNKGKPTIVSTNSTLSQLQERYGERICSRLLTMERLPFCGNDIRIIKSMAK